MKILAVDTSSRNCSVSIVEVDKNKNIKYNMNSKENSVEFSIEFQKAVIIRKNGCFFMFL